jgi:hypothetical protein
MSGYRVRDERSANDVLAACKADACRQGRARCPVPDACRRPSRYDYEGARLLRWFLVAVFLVLAAIGFAGLFGGKL